MINMINIIIIDQIIIVIIPDMQWTVTAYMYKNFLFYRYMSLIFSVLKSESTNLQKWDLLHTITGENQTSVITQANNILILKCWQNWNSQQILQKPSSFAKGDAG